MTNKGVGRQPSLARAAVVSLLSVSLGGCAQPRLQLQSPGPQASEAERLEAYEELRPLGRITYRLESEYGVSSVQQLRLANNSLVTDPRDLLPLVPPQSNTVKAAQKFGVHHKREEGWRWGARGFTLGTMIFVVAIWAPSLGQERWPWLTVGLLSVAGVITSVFMARREGKLATRAAADAFSYYHGDLLEHLELEVQQKHPGFRQRPSPQPRIQTASLKLSPRLGR